MRNLFTEVPIFTDDYVNIYIEDEGCRFKIHDDGELVFAIEDFGVSAKISKDDLNNKGILFEPYTQSFVIYAKNKEEIEDKVEILIQFIKQVSLDIERLYYS